MASKLPRWLVGCGIGCGVALVLALAALGWGGVKVGRMMGDIDRSTELRTEIEERFDAPEDFTPAADGGVPAERLERFLQVRRALDPLCSRFDDVVGRIEEMDGREEAPGFGEIFGVMGGVLGFPRLMADHVGARNQALLDAEMGLGEYTYIYVMAYSAGPAADRDDERLRDKPLSRRVRRATTGMLERQRELLAGQDAGAGLQALLDREIEALHSDEDRRPWQDELPEPIAGSLQPRREELAMLACPLAAEFALGRTQRRGLTVHGD